MTLRRYIRMWLRYLAIGEVARPDPRDGRPVAVSEPWQERVFAEVGEALWRKVKEGRDDLGTAAAQAAKESDDPWASPRAGVPDFRLPTGTPSGMSHASTCPRALERRHAAYLGYQLLSRCDYSAVEPELRSPLTKLAPRRGLAGLAPLLRDVPRVAELPSRLAGGEGKSRRPGSDGASRFPAATVRTPRRPLGVAVGSRRVEGLPEPGPGPFELVEETTASTRARTRQLVENPVQLPPEEIQANGLIRA